MSLSAAISKYLLKKQLEPQVILHRTVFTAYDLAQTLRRPLDTIAKTLLVKTDHGMTLAVLGANVRLDLKKLAKVLETKKLSIASEKDMVKAFKVKPGAITAFGGLHGVPVVLEAGLAKAKKALFPTGSFTESFELAMTRYLKAEAPTVGRFSQKTNLKLQSKAPAKPKRRAKKSPTRTKVKSKKAKSRPATRKRRA
jgi:prolyl-tRNA editing enzyme YbaK/EbsC (Cys-tRNA(Pro) deacylase)